MKTLQKLRAYFAGIIFILSIISLIKGGGTDEYFYWFNGIVLLSSISTLLEYIPSSKKETKEIK